MLAHVNTFTIDGLNPRRVSVEVDVRPGLPQMTIVGLADLAVREARERVRAALANQGFEMPLRRVTINLAPASLPKGGPGFDLAMAIGILAASGQVPLHKLAGLAIVGELSLSGGISRGPGALVLAEGAQQAGLSTVMLPKHDVSEASLVEGIRVLGVSTLREAASALSDPERDDACSAIRTSRSTQRSTGVDLADVHGQSLGRRALEIAAAGNHSLLLIGPPGSGKTMLARRLPGLLPEMTRAEALEVTRIHSVCGLHDGPGLVSQRPFRAPHHGTSVAGMVGGGSVIRPGEITLAHGGVLFLDELPEFRRDVLESLRQPIEEQTISLVRQGHRRSFPCRTLLVAAANPCPCGFAPDSRCRCGPSDLQRYHRKLSGPLLDRVDLLVRCPVPTADEIAQRSQDTTESVAARVRQARVFSQKQTLDVVQQTQPQGLQLPAADLLEKSYRRGLLSARGRARVLRVARTIANLDGSELIGKAHLAEAFHLRQDVAEQSLELAS